MIFRKVLISILIFISFSGLAQVSKEQKELIKTAEELFEKKQFKDAQPLYSQLLSLYPTKGQYSFYYGACLIENNQNISKAIKYLSYAVKKQAQEPFVYYYLGRAYHLQYDFENAIEQYNKFLQKASPKQAKEKNVQREIDICNNGLQLVKYADNLIVLENNPTKTNNFQYAYKLPNMGGKFVVKPEQFKTKADIKQKRKELLFVSDLGFVLFSSLGKDKKGDRDIYWSRKDKEGNFLPSKRLDNTINTKYDEIYPFLKADGKTLYFCSKGHNTMGGYDIFKSVYDSINTSWSTPENLDFPINTPYDDLLYVVDSNDYLAYFASNRETKENRLNIYKIEVNHSPVKREMKELEDIKQVAKLNLTPLAEKTKIKEQSKKQESIDKTEIAEAPKQTFDFNAVKKEQIQGAKSYTKIINEDLRLLEKDKASVEGKKNWFAQLANSKTNQLSDLNRQMRSMEEKSSYTELSKNQDYLTKRKERKKLKTESSLIVKIAENLSKELKNRVKEIKITKLLLQDSTNNNTQDLVQNINANRKFIKENRKDTFSLKNHLLTQKTEKESLNQQAKILDEELKTFQSDFELVLQSTKNKKEKYQASDEFEKDANRNALVNALNRLNETKKEVVKTEKEQIEVYEKIEDLETEIAFLEQINNQSFDKSTPLTEDTQSQNFEEILANSKQLENAIEKSQQNYILQQAKDKYDHQTKTVVENPEALIASLNQETEQALADNESSEDFENNFDSNFEEDSNTEDNQPEDSANTTEEIESETVDNQDNNIELDNNIEEIIPNQATEKELETISKEMITEVSLPNVLNFEARKLFQESARNQQLSDSLKTLSEQKASQVSSLKTEEEKEIFENEIEELNQLADIKLHQAKQNYQKALVLEDSYAQEHPSDTLTDFLLESGELNFSESEKASPEMIEYKTSVFKEHFYNQDLEETSNTIVAVEALLNREGISNERKAELETKLSQLKKQEQDLQTALNNAHKTQNSLENKQVQHSQDKENILLSSTKTSLSEKIIFNKEQLETKEKLEELRSEIKEKKGEFEGLNQRLTQEEISLEEVATKKALIAKEEEIQTLQNQVWTQRNDIAELEQYANLLESKILNQQIETLNKRSSNKAHQLEQEAKVLSRKAEAIRKTVKSESEYNSFAVEMLEKANLYELTAINRQKSALNLYAELSEARSKKNFSSANTPSLGNGIQLQPEEEELIAEYENLYHQAEITALKLKRVEEKIEREQYLLENIYFDKNKEEQESRVASLKDLRFNLQKDLFNQKSRANKKKYLLNQNILSREIENTLKPDIKSKTDYYLLEAEFYQEESEKTLLDTVSDFDNLKASLNSKMTLEEEAIKAQDFAFKTLYANNTDDYSLIKVNSLIKNDRVYKSDLELEKEISSDFILANIKLSKQDQKVWQETQKLEEKKFELEQEYSVLQADINLLKDSLNNVTKDRQTRNLNKQIAKLEDKQLGYWSRIAKLSEPIYQKRYQIYKNYIAQYRLKDNSLEANVGRSLEKEANQAFRKAENLRSATFDASSFEKTYELLSQAKDSEKEALDKIERAFASYLDIQSVPADSELVATTQEKLPEETQSENVRESEISENTDLTPSLEEVTLNNSDTTEVLAVNEIVEDNTNETQVVELSDTLSTPKNEAVEDANMFNVQDDDAVAENKSQAEAPAIEFTDSLSTKENITYNNPDTTEVLAVNEITEDNTNETQVVELSDTLSTSKNEAVEDANMFNVQDDDAVAENKSQAEAPAIEFTDSLSTKENITYNNPDTTEVLAVNEIVEDNANETQVVELSDTLSTYQDEVLEDANTFNNKDDDTIAENKSQVESQTTEIKDNNTFKEEDTASLLDTETAENSNNSEQSKTIPQQTEAPIQILKENAYSDANPIQINTELPDGIIYKIQIGAFSKPVPNDVFKGLTPVTGETRANSKYVRYFVGLFNTYEAAKVALPYVQQSGYEDAFIVAYKNGKREPIYLARKEDEAEQNYQALAKAEKAQTEAVVEQLSNIYNVERAEPKPLNPAQNLSDIKKAMYTVQVGVYRSHISHDKLYNLTPLFTDYTASGLVRYTVGQFVDYNTALERQNEIREIGIPDAFVTAYKNGKHITINQARKDLATINEIEKRTDTAETTPSVPNTYSNLYYSVQIGAFAQTVPIETVSSLIQISKEQDLINFTDATNKTIYAIGKTKSLSQIRRLKDDLVQKGLTDAFIIAFDGKQKVSISEAQKVLEP